MRRKLVIAWMSFGVILSTSQPLAAQAANPPSLAGSWELILIATTPPVSEPPVAPVPGLATFTSGGSVVETDATVLVPSLTAPFCARPVGETANQVSVSATRRKARPAIAGRIEFLTARMAGLRLIG